MRNITAVILCGGLGTRLRSVVSDRPKCLAEVNGRPFIYYILDQLKNAGIEYVVLAVDYMWEVVEKVVGDEYRDMVIAYSIDELEGGGTGAALRSALNYIGSPTVLIMNGDTYVDVNMGDFSWHTYHDGDYANGLILNVFGGPTNMGVYLFDTDTLRILIPIKEKYSIETQLLSALANHNLQTYIINRPYNDIGTPESYAVAGEFMKNVEKETR